MKTIKYIITPPLALSLFITLVLPSILSAQQVIIAEDLRESAVSKDFGMNRKHFRHAYIGVHFLAGQAEESGADVRYGKSWSFEYGVRYKRKFSEFYSVGGELFTRRLAIWPEQIEGKMIPGPDIYDDEKLVYLQLGGGLYHRINVGERGNYIGRFFDTGAYAAWNFHVRHVYFKEQDDAYLRVRRTGMSFPALFEYGVLARLGFNNIVLKASYRLSDTFRSSAELPDIPRLHFGVEVGLHSM